MCERFRCDASLRFLLQPIVANRRRGVQTLFDVTGIEFHPARGEPPRFRRFVSPHARVTIGLQFDAHRALVGVARKRGALERAGEILHVMTDLVREHVRLREIARRAELLMKIVEEAQVQIHLAVAWTVERPGRGARKAARGLNANRERGRQVVG